MSAVVKLRNPEEVASSVEFTIEALGFPYRNDNTDLVLLKKVTMGEVSKHDSVLEHIVFRFVIENISRQCLQHMVRHRIASLTVESSRYSDDISWTYPPELTESMSEGVANEVFTTLEKHYIESERVYNKLMGLTNNKDIAKYALPEGRMTKLAWTINFRSLLNFLKLRETDRHGKPHFEIKNVAAKVRCEIEKIPAVKFLLDNITL